MKKLSSQRNIEALILIAHRLEEICTEVIFVGGCVMGLLITDKFAPDVRFTIDVDCIVDVFTKPNYHALAKKLRAKGFREMVASGDHPICRWNCDGILLDIMPTDKSVLGFSNRWYKEAISNAIDIQISASLNIKIISAPFFLATKLEAFKDRGKNDFLFSHDLEDIISLIDGRPEIVNDISQASSYLKQYLSSEFSSFMSNKQFMHSLPGHLNYLHETQDRQKIVQQRLQAIIDLGK